MSRRHTHPALTQELNYEAALCVARLLCEGCEARDELLAAARPLTEATGSRGRQRAAATVMTRLGLGRRRRVQPAALHRLLAALPEAAGRQLLGYATAGCESMLAGVSREILYTYFVDGGAPEGFGPEEFSAANANGLFEVAGAITHAGVAAYARRRWRVSDPSPLRRALRLLRKAGILGSTWISRGGSRCLGYFPILGLPDLACFAYALYSMRENGGYVRLDRLRAGLFVHLFLLRPVAVDYLMQHAAAAGLVTEAHSAIASLAFDSLETAVEPILATRPVGMTP